MHTYINLTEPLKHNGKIILSNEFVQDTNRFYKERNLIVIYCDGSDPPDYLFFIPYNEIVKEPLLTYGDLRIRYKNQFFVHGESSWTNDLDFYDDYVTISLECGVYIFSLDFNHNDISSVKKWYISFPSGFIGNVSDVKNGIVNIRYIAISLLPEDYEDEEFESLWEKYSNFKEMCKEVTMCLNDLLLYDDK